jgi:hypothetical protein
LFSTAALDGGVIPDQFTLFVVAAKKTFSCNIVWREGGRIGVVFC